MLTSDVTFYKQNAIELRAFENVPRSERRKGRGKGRAAVAKHAQTERTAGHLQGRIYGAIITN